MEAVSGFYLFWFVPREQEPDIEMGVVNLENNADENNEEMG